MIEYDSETDSDNEDDEDNIAEMNYESSKNTCDNHCGRWMRGHLKTECEFANNLISVQLSDKEDDGAAGDDPEGATVESEWNYSRR